MNRIEIDLITNLETKLIGLAKDKSVMILLDNFQCLFSTSSSNSEFHSKLSIRIITTILKLIEKNKYTNNEMKKKTLNFFLLIFNFNYLDYILF